MTSAKPRGNSFRLLGTWDDEGTLLFSQGHKNFKDKTPCNWCHLKKPMMYRYAIAKKGEVPQFSTEVYCSVLCYRRMAERPNSKASP